MSPAFLENVGLQEQLKSLWMPAAKMDSRRTDPEGGVTQEEVSESEGRTHPRRESRQGGLILKMICSRREGPVPGGNTHSRGGPVGEDSP